MELKNILSKVHDNELDLETAEAQIRSMGYVPVSDIAKVDIFRRHRTGIMEAILAEGKDPEDVVQIAKAQVAATGRVLITRLGVKHREALESDFKPVEIEWSLHRNAAVVHDGTPSPRTGGVVAIITAGTADIDVAEEARMVAHELGCETIAIYDVGVAGFHRLVGEMLKLQDRKPDAIVVAAGREGTLPTVVSGLVDVPVIGVPVSTGYGAGAKGEAALLSMLQSCSVLSVVNIDAGFVAGSFAARIANTVAKARSRE
ncbi:nickel pincer cofactor biosynthesis protein LarB [Methanolobus chelungpuianus]|uniref:Phosphoribosylaminoimidazole carboxylase n=1 Tax=Methanolobus chelungpuianus TaxID=502115 RepID=A0AAE3H9Y8_9EURY|nr:nickel pincer cofactor biosynthesis protein LarB [Methanolobus chelungpuianus]MCQ6962234.1 phosphoribosylaminoimidazole carboxylase [Methanolobus chelungpuianus]